MRVIIWKKKKGQKASVWAENLNLKEAKQKLSEVYMSALEFFFDEIGENDGISADKKQLTICNTEYFIEKDTRL